ncbi:YidH family protein [Scytonema sp. PRP1]|uniref:YidH family protein n=1 Tax=Scytonema sp. PRP1 TaxID=3120513 RepID=UPI002FD6A9FA
MSEMPKIDRQREHQANERTFLAWLRTSIALIGFGFAIARFGLFIRQLNFTLTQQQQEPAPHRFFTSENLGISLVIFGIMTLVLAAWRYNQVFWQIEQGNYQPSRFTVWVMTGVVIIFGILSIPLLLLRTKAPSSSYRLPNQPHSRNFR